MSLKINTMKLFLASEAKHPDSIEKLRQYLGGFEGKSMTYVPTAANGEQNWGEWKNGGSWNLVQTLGLKIDVVLLEEFRNPEVIEHFKNKDIIWFAGGSCSYLMYWILATEIETQLKEIIKNSNTVYVGSSAGSMITAPTLGVASWYIGETDAVAKNFSGLGLVDFDIYPHYEESMLEEIKKNYQGKKLYLLKNGEEILVEDDKITVQGEERIISAA